jgi:alpha-1,2-mannosyltransferase
VDPVTAKPAHAARSRPGALVLAAMLLIASALLLWWMVWPANPFPSAPAVGTFLAWMVLPFAVRALRQVPRNQVAAVIVAGALLLGLAAMSAPPRTSNDSARYAWDGIVQKAGISPYAYVPVDETLSGLRPGWLFQPGAAGTDGQTVCSGDLFGTDSVPALGFPSGSPLCTAINRPQVPTIYPPTAEIYFFVARLAVPDNVGYLPFQLGGLLIGVAVTLLLIKALPRAGLPPHLAAVWAWSPFLQLEAVNNAHVDVLGGALLLAAGMLLVTGKPLRSGVAFGAAVATKLIPMLAAPALLFKRPAAFIAAAVGTFAFLYIPYVLACGFSVLGFLPGYLKEEGYSQAGGIRFGLAQIVSTGPWPALLSAGVLALVSLYVLRTTGPGNIWHRQTVMIGWSLVIISPNYPWYALLLLPFVVLSRRWEYLAVILALDVIYMVPSTAMYGNAINQAILVAAVLAIASGAWLRRHASIRASARMALSQAEQPALQQGAVNRWP